MTNLKSITYSQYVAFDRKDAENLWQSKHGEFENEEDREEDEKCFRGWRYAMLTLARKQNRKKYTYIFSDSHPIVRLKRSNLGGGEYFGNLFTLINRNTGMMYHYLTNLKKNETRLNKIALHFNSKDWEVEYKMNKNNDETKNILGFDCFKLTVEKILTNKKESKIEVTYYEMFVTDKLKLPARIVVPFRETITELCALEIKVFDSRIKNSYSLQKAIDFQTEIEDKMMVIPDAYKHLDSLLE